MISVVIPNYNGLEYLKKCLEALANQSIKDFDIIIVDDASTEKNIEDIIKGYENITLIKHDENKGFAASVNDGIKASKSDYVFLLNNDAYPESDCIENLLKALKESSYDVFSIQCMMISAKNRELIDSAGDFFNIFGYARSRGKDKKIEAYNKPGEIFSACAGAAVYKREILERIGLFDETHFAYLEDVDLGYRARIYGYINKYEPLARVYHEGSATSGSRHNEFKVKLSARNSILVRYKNQTVLQKIVNFPCTQIGILVKLIYFSTKHLGSAYRAGLKEGCALKKDEKVRNSKLKFDNKMRRKALKTEFELIKNIIY